MDFRSHLFPTTQHGYKYILAFVGVLSKFIIAKAVADDTAQTTFQFLIQYGSFLPRKEPISSY